MEWKNFGIYQLNQWSDEFASRITVAAKAELQKKEEFRSRREYISLVEFDGVKTAYWSGGANGGILKLARDGTEYPYLLKIFKNETTKEIIAYQKRVYRTLERLVRNRPELAGYFPKCYFIENGFLYHGKSYPFILMDQVDGKHLDAEYILSLSKEQIKATADAFLRFILETENASIAFSDLAGDNILINTNDAGEVHITALDFDELYLPGMKPRMSLLAGKPSWNHRNRRMDNPVSLDANTGAFSALLIYLSLLTLASDKEQYLGLLEKNKFENDAPLLFTIEDLEAPHTSPLFWKILRHDDKKIQYLAQRFKEYAVDADPAKTPLLRDILIDYYQENETAIVKAANNRNPQAMESLSEMFEYGLGCSRNTKAADYWREKMKSYLSSSKK